ncbi:MAG: universal stress protein [Methanophagales archaeon]|nr:universal stress protein [Methanophagales archaeon]
MFRKILYPTDFSDCATKALEKEIRGSKRLVLVPVLVIKRETTLWW